MGIEDRDYYRELQKEKEIATAINKLNNSRLWCRRCSGLTVNALTLICEACNNDNTVIWNSDNQNTELEKPNTHLHTNKEGLLTRIINHIINWYAPPTTAIRKKKHEIPKRRSL